MDRKAYLGGSDVAGVLNLSQYSSPLSVWYEKLHEQKPKIETSYMEWGKRLEPVISDKFEQEMPGVRCRKAAYESHKIYPYLGGHIDRLVEEEDGSLSILEVKTTHSRNEKDWKDTVPDYYMCQLQHYFSISGLEKGYFAVLIGGNIFKIVKVDRDDEYIENLTQKCVEFWNNHILSGVAPKSTGKKCDCDILKELWTPGDTSVMRGNILDDSASKYLQLSMEKKKLEEEMRWLQNDIREHMKNHQRSESYSYFITQIPQKQFRVDTQKLKSLYPDVYEEVKREIETTPIRVKKKEEAYLAYLFCTTTLLFPLRGQEKNADILKEL